MTEEQQELFILEQYPVTARSLFGGHSVELLKLIGYPSGKVPLSHFVNRLCEEKLRELGWSVGETE